LRLEALREVGALHDAYLGAMFTRERNVHPGDDFVVFDVEPSGGAGRSCWLDVINHTCATFLRRTVSDVKTTKSFARLTFVLWLNIAARGSRVV